MLRAPDRLRTDLATSLTRLKEGLRFCPVCQNITDREKKCDVCLDEQRDHSLLCVVETPLDALALLRFGNYHGLFHVLHGVIAPLEGVGPNDLQIISLVKRVGSHDSKIKEVILAMNPSLEGEATATYISKELTGVKIKITRIARGLPTGAEMQWADPTTISNSLSGRREY